MMNIDQNTGTFPQDSDIDDLQAIVAYLQGVGISLPAAVTEPDDLPPLAKKTEALRIEEEISRLAEDQCLAVHRGFTVYCARAEQIPLTLREITRLRELTFREFDEGSGQEVDSDSFDHTYHHLFVWDAQARAIVGAYRLGQTDVILAEQGVAGVYLAQMFDFTDSFFEGTPLLEVGRSFIVPEYQKAHASLYLLWLGIGQFLVRHPQYRRLYGLVSMSRVYDSRATAVVRDTLVEPLDQVRAKAPYKPELGEVWQDFMARQGPFTMRDVSKLVRGLEDDKRDVPVLIRHYHKLGAKFLEAAIDGNFNNTPGLLLRLDVAAMPQKYIKTYLGEGGQAYLDYGQP